MGDFRRITALADYYLALPILSLSLDRAMLDSELFCASIRDHAFELFEMGAKLRNSRLFREALIWLVGKYGHSAKPQYKKLSDPKLKLIAGYAHGEIAKKVSLVVSKLLILNSSSWETGGDWLHRIRHEIYGPFDFALDLADKDLDDSRLISYPQYLRSIWSVDDLPEFPDLDDLLRNKLALSGTSLRSGEGKCSTTIGSLRRENEQS
jgi:hypothetical protein